MTNIYDFYYNRIYHSILNYFSSSTQITYDISGTDEYVPTILTPLNIFLKESENMIRQDICDIIQQNKDFRTICFIIPRYYSSYLLCHIIFDILDVLSNELFYVQTKIVFRFDSSEQKISFIDEFKRYIKSNILFIQKNKILPIYAKFINSPSYHVEYTVNFEQRFHILFLKEVEDSFSIQRLHFSIDL